MCLVLTGVVVGAAVIICLTSRAASDQNVETLSRQMILQQLFVEESIRAGGNSGIKRVRAASLGTKNYHSENHASSRRVVSIHNHDNNERTIGMGEVIAVMNGVEFRSRHNDFGLRQPSKTSGEYHATDDIAFPPVPQSVLDKATVEEQIDEMREYFKAWSTEDPSHRNYIGHFTANLCYMEGAWTHATDNIEESFESDRHFLDASSFFDLHEKIRFTSYTGGKDLLENYAFLPTTIIEITNSTPVFAQWNYRILCHPLPDDLPVSRLHLRDDLTTRMRNMWTKEQMGASRAGHFQVNPQDQEEFEDGTFNYNFLDEMMEQIPGKDNYGGVLYDDAFGIDAYHYNDNTQKLNTAFYHRFYQGKEADAMGTTNRKRGYGDDNMFMAQTSQGKVAGMKLDNCIGEAEPCIMDQKWSYAIPLEIIYTSPLSAWNPFGIEYKGQHNSVEGKTVTADGRNGGLTIETALNGTNSKNYYRTPFAFFEDEDTFIDPADTTENGVGVLDSQGIVRKTSSTGVRVFFPPIPGVGTLRQRYPIFPIHGEGSSVWKELNALSDIVMNPLSNGYLFRENPALMSSGSDASNATIFNFILKAPTDGNHSHEVDLTADQFVKLYNGVEVTDVLTSMSAGHIHTLTLKFVLSTNPEWAAHLEYKKCDSNDRGKKCSDNHGTWLKSMTI